MTWRGADGAPFLPSQLPSVGTISLAGAAKLFAGAKTPLATVLAAFPSIPQRRASRVPWRFPSMTTFAKVAVAAVASTTGAKLAARNLTVERRSAGGNAVTAATDVSFEVATGEFVCLLGPSGCGKTSILNVLAGLDRPSAGQALVDGAPITGPLDPSVSLIGQRIVDSAVLSAETKRTVALVA